MRRFEWDPAKARANERKHGISFADATFVFDDPFAVLEQDRIDDGEYRWRTIGMADAAAILVVAHLLWDDDVEVVRIISARRAERKERRRYEQARNLHG